MTGPHIITHLRALILETEERIAEYINQRTKLELLKVNLGGVIAYYESLERPNSYPANRSVARLYQRGEAFAQCVRTLQQHGPELTTRQLAIYLLEAKNLNATDNSLVRAMGQSLIEILKMRQTKGEIVSDRKQGVHRVWRLP